MVAIISLKKKMPQIYVFFCNFVEKWIFANVSFPKTQHFTRVFLYRFNRTISTKTSVADASSVSAATIKAGTGQMGWDLWPKVSIAIFISTGFFLGNRSDFQQNIKESKWMKTIEQHFSLEKNNILEGSVFCGEDGWYRILSNNNTPVLISIPDSNKRKKSYTQAPSFLGCLF